MSGFMENSVAESRLPTVNRVVLGGGVWPKFLRKAQWRELG